MQKRSEKLKLKKQKTFCHISIISVILLGGGTGPLDLLATPRGGGKLLLKNGTIDGYAY